MNTNLRTENYGLLPFEPGLPDNFSRFALPQAKVFHAQGAWGLVCYQELKTSRYTLRHFLFLLKQTLTFFTKETEEGVQLLLSLKGEVCFALNVKAVVVKEKEYTLLSAANEETSATVQSGKLCSVLNTYYTSDAYSDLFSLFPPFKKIVQRSLAKARSFILPAKAARFSVHDDITAIWHDRYAAIVEEKHIEMRLKATLFSSLAQTYAPAPAVVTTTYEMEKAAAAKAIILRDLKVRIPNREIAKELNVTVSVLKRVFHKVYGVGLYHFLRQTRMQKAREMLLKGALLKTVALEVGMRPKNFPKEFKSFFGYTVTQLKKGLT